LREGTGEVMSGNLDYRVGTDSEDEIGELSRDFDKMTSNLRRSQQELMRYNASLEARVAERTHEVEALLKQKDEMIAQLGHDLKNPITPLLTLLPEIRDQEKDPEQRALLDAAIASTVYLRQLTVNTMRLAALNLAADQPGTALAKVNIRQQVSEVLSRRELAARQSGITMENHIREDIVVEADHMGIQEVLDNLVANAIKFTPEGGTVVFAAQTEGDFVTVSVKDTGIGMTPEQLARAFDEFYRADPSREDLDSSGLGLTICKRIVEQHGGRIWAESEGLGKGTTIYFTLRLVGVASTLA
jgi:signal transduction histidine kinase